MRILELTRATEKKLLAARLSHDAQAQRVAGRIVDDVRRSGDAALFSWTRKLDGSDTNAKSLWVSQKEIRAAARCVNPGFLNAVRQASRNIRRIAWQQLPKPWSLSVERGVTIRQLVRPIESVGCYIPGGHASLVSTLLMTAIPAQVAGVPRIVVVCPKPNNEVLAAAHFLGLREVARIGGAQAVAALAYGTKATPRVEKICGPGNKYVTAAKQIVSTDCAIDLPAGPTEAIVLADRGNPAWIAADLLAQAEHAPDAGSFLLTTSRKLAKQVARQVSAQLAALAKDNPAHRSIRSAGAILIAPSLPAACNFINRFAPEHLSLASGSQSLVQALVRQIRSAGTIFLGPWSAQPLGDYISGSNHVLPTAGWARRRGGLSAADFVKCMVVQEISRSGFAGLADGAEHFAGAENLPAHYNAVRIRR
jgi:histidinol dehydrogenase